MFDGAGQRIARPGEDLSRLPTGTPVSSITDVSDPENPRSYAVVGESQQSKDTKRKMQELQTASQPLQMTTPDSMMGYGAPRPM